MSLAVFDNFIVFWFFRWFQFSLWSHRFFLELPRYLSLIKHHFYNCSVVCIFVFQSTYTKAGFISKVHMLYVPLFFKVLTPPVLPLEDGRGLYVPLFFKVLTPGIDNQEELIPLYVPLFFKVLTPVDSNVAPFQ